MVAFSRRRLATLATACAFAFAWTTASLAQQKPKISVSSLTLPVFNQNQGPIAEAKANRAKAAAHFLTVQTTAIAEIDRALAGYEAALQKSGTAKSLLENLRKQPWCERVLAGRRPRLSAVENEQEMVA